jgi:K+ transporter
MVMQSRGFWTLIVIPFCFVPQLTVASLSTVIASAALIVDVVPFVRRSHLLAILPLIKQPHESPRQHGTEVCAPAVRQFPIKRSTQH